MGSFEGISEGGGSGQALGSPCAWTGREDSGIRLRLEARPYIPSCVTQFPALERKSRVRWPLGGPSNTVAFLKLLFCAGLEVGCLIALSASRSSGFCAPQISPLYRHSEPLLRPHVAVHFSGLVTAAFSRHTLIPTSHLQSRN